MLLFDQISHSYQRTVRKLNDSEIKAIEAEITARIT